MLVIGYLSPLASRYRWLRHELSRVNSQYPLRIIHKPTRSTKALQYVRTDLRHKWDSPRVLTLVVHNNHRAVRLQRKALDSIHRCSSPGNHRLSSINSLSSISSLSRDFNSPVTLSKVTSHPAIRRQRPNKATSPRPSLGSRTRSRLTRSSLRLYQPVA